MHPCPGKWVANGRAAVCYAQAAHAYSAGVKCRYCSSKSRQLALCNGSREENVFLYVNPYAAGG